MNNQTILDEVKDIPEELRLVIKRIRNLRAQQITMEKEIGSEIADLAEFGYLGLKKERLG
jgi:hypothetical protein